MRNSIAFSLLIFFSFSASALILKVTGKNQELLFNHEINPHLPSNVGQISVDLFDQHQISYQGGVGGFSEIFHLGQDLEVISDREMKAYGWCFSVDGLAPDTMADETLVQDPKSEIYWFYAYAHYKDGEWIAQCKKP